MGQALQSKEEDGKNYRWWRWQHKNSTATGTQQDLAALTVCYCGTWLSASKNMFGRTLGLVAPCNSNE